MLDQSKREGRMKSVEFGRARARLRSYSGFIAAMLFLSILFLTMANDVSPQTSSAKIVVLPVQNTFYAHQTPPGSVFVINITVDSVTDLASWQVNLTWDPTLLDFSQIWLPSDHAFSGRSVITPTPDVKNGSVVWGCALASGPYWTYVSVFSGTGTLCQVELRILPPPRQLPVSCELTLANEHVDTFLLDGQGYDTEFALQNGVFTYRELLSVSISPLDSSISLSQSVSFASVVEGGIAPYTYQWYLNGNSVSGATSNTWTFTPSTTGVYYVYLRVTDSSNTTAQSETARIMVFSVPVGGYSVSPYRHATSNPLAINLALVIGVAIFFTMVRRKTTRRRP